ncbi:MAG: tail fiber domain-containing protein, partial [Alphaproteobacteria bacterium]|nr:tail fiber domain-containing protein [Alphaproteobacteria bacterium]
NRYLFTNNIRHDTGTQLNLWSTNSIRLLSNANNILEVKPTQIDFNANVVSAYSITADDLIETSDKRLKDNIENVDEDCSEIVKKVEVKTYNMKSDDKKKSHIGFVAQDVKEILPKKFEAVVNDDGERMGINYGKMSAILWKCCQEQQSKIEHLESRLFELEDIVKELKDNKKPKAKAKAKSKS